MSDPIRDLKQELLAAAERRHALAAAGDGRRRFRGRLARNRLLLTAATLSLTAAVVLVSAAPWTTSPGFLEKAQAALTPPDGAILHQKWEMTSISTDPACTVSRGPSEIWIDETTPHRYRVLLNDLPPPVEADPDPRVLVCASGTASELGGEFDTHETLQFVPPDTLRALPGRFMFPTDPVTELREAISAGNAHDEGKTQLDGRTVERIRIDPPSNCPFSNCPRESTYAYVDPETFYPVETRGPGFIAMPFRDVVWSQLVMRVTTFEYLPRTEANLALTDIRAQHPNATGP